MKLLVLAAGFAFAGGLWPFGGSDDEPGPKDRIADLQEQELELRATPAAPDSAQLARQQYRNFLELAEGSNLKLKDVIRLHQTNPELFAWCS